MRASPADSMETNELEKVLASQFAVFSRIAGRELRDGEPLAILRSTIPKRDLETVRLEAMHVVLEAFNVGSTEFQNNKYWTVPDIAFQRFVTLLADQLTKKTDKDSLYEWMKLAEPERNEAAIYKNEQIKQFESTLARLQGELQNARERNFDIELITRLESNIESTQKQLRAAQDSKRQVHGAILALADARELVGMAEEAIKQGLKLEEDEIYRRKCEIILARVGLCLLLVASSAVIVTALAALAPVAATTAVNAIGLGGLAPIIMTNVAAFNAFMATSTGLASAGTLAANLAMGGTTALTLTLAYFSNEFIGNLISENKRSASNVKEKNKALKSIDTIKKGLDSIAVDEKIEAEVSKAHTQSVEEQREQVATKLKNK